MTRSAALALVVALAACRGAPPRPSAGGDPAVPPLDEAALDRSVSPCDDFYQFACGGWIAQTEIPADKPAWGRFQELSERVAAELRTLAEAAAAGRLGPEDRFAGKVGDFYASCVDEAGVEARGLADLEAEWARIDAATDRDRLAGEMARLAAARIAAPFALTAGPDARDATRMIAQLPQGGLSLPDRDYYLADDERTRAIRSAYVAHVARMLRLAGVPANQADAQARQIEDLERALAASHLTNVEMRDPIRTYNRVDLAAVEKLAPAFPWGIFLDGVGRPDIRAMVLSTPRFVEEAGRLFASAPLDQWRAYLRWHVLRAAAAARAVPRAFVDEAFAFRSANFTGETEQEPRWRICVAETDQALGQALGQAYVRRHFGPAGKERTSRLVAQIEAAMGRDLDAVPWMDAPTRAQARAKLAKVSNKIGYPDVWRNYTALAVSRESFFRNFLAARRFETNHRLSEAGKPVDRNEWWLSPATVNAWYAPDMNQMTFPAGILERPFFNRAAPEPVNYGAIGMVVGHELTHGYDDRGRRYDGEGNLRDWWTPDVAKAFESRARCLVGQYDRYEAAPGQKLNGELTLGENIADLGGVKLAYAGLRAARAGKGRGEKILGFTPEQAFFVGYAQIWCAKLREPYARMQARTNPHSQPRFRVLGPLGNFPPFAAAFGCAEGSPMVRPPAERCEIW